MTRARAQVRARATTRLGAAERRDYAGLHPYQRQGVDFLASHESCLLADSMGLGKSVQTLRALPRRPRVILVCPASVLSVWQEQVERWRPDLRIDVDSGLRLPDPGEIVGVSYDSLPEPHRAPSGLLRLLLEPTEDVWLVLDEVQYAKNGKAQRTQKVRVLRRQCGRCSGLSATPMEGYPEDLWGVLMTLGLHLVVFPGGWEEVVQLFGGRRRIVYDRRLKRRREAGYVWGRVDPEVNVRLREVMLRREQDDPSIRLQLPRVRRIDVPVAAPKDLRDMLDEVMGTAWEDVKPGDLPPFEVMSEARALLAESRVPAALEWVQNADPRVPLLVFSAHLGPIDAVAGLRLGDRRVAKLTGATGNRERGELVRDFQAGKIGVLAMTIDAGGVGLNLTRAGAILFVDRDYTPSKNRQAEARAARQGNLLRRVDVFRMVSRHPLDLRLHEILDDKERLITGAVGGV